MSVMTGPTGPTRSERRPLRCAGCGYEIAVYRSLPVCPMCREIDWEPAAWRPSPRRAEA
jgi:hypothetical protein